MGALLGLNVLDDFGEFIRLHTAAYIFIHNDYRRLAASPNAAANFQGNHPIRGRIPGFNSQQLLRFFNNLVYSADVTGGTQAEFNRVFAPRGGGKKE